VYQINLITPPDKLYNDVQQVLLVSFSKELQNSFQEEYLKLIEEDVNVYVYNGQTYDKEEINWLLDTFKQVDIVVIDLDNVPTFLRELMSYMIAKPKTYWLTKAVDSVYNHISNNKVYNFEFLFKLGGPSETK
jgi:hypothetical protein